jgi:hypothetical protein
MNTNITDQAYEHYEESREYPRIKNGFPVTLSLDNKQSVTATVYDISPDGLQIRCSRNTATILNPTAKRITPRDNLMVKAQFSLPIEDELKTIRVDCKIYYFVILPGQGDEDVAFGLKFKNVEGRSVKHVGQHIMSELEPFVT